VATSDVPSGNLIYAKPRLRVDDKSQGAASGHEAFFNTCFGIALTGSGKIQGFLLNANHGTTEALLNFLLYFSAYWSAYRTGANYAVRYNNSDLSHKFFWTLYGLAVAGMLIHTDGGVQSTLNEKYFSRFSALVHFMIGLKNFHVAAYIEEIRTSATWHGVASLSACALWLVIASGVDDGHLDGTASVIMAAVLVEPATTTIIDFLGYRVRGSENLAAQSCSGMYVSVLGAGASIITRLNPMSYGVEQRGNLRAAALLGFMIFINLKLVVFDLDHTDVNSDLHAAKQSPLSRVFWYTAQPLIVMSAVVMTAGYGLLLDHPTDIPSTEISRRGRVLSCFGCAALIAVLLVQRLLNAVEDRVKQSRRLAAIRTFQTFMYLACAVVTAMLPKILPADKVRADRVNLILAVITSVLVLSATVDEFYEAYLRHVDRQETAKAPEGGETAPLKGKGQSTYSPIV